MSRLIDFNRKVVFPYYKSQYFNLYSLFFIMLRAFTLNIKIQMLSSGNTPLDYYCSCSCGFGLGPV